MHEFAICEGLVQAVREELAGKSPRPRLLKVRVIVGRMRQIVPENLDFAYHSLTHETEMAGSELEIVAAPVKVQCVSCRCHSEISSRIFECRHCGSGELKVLGGMELYIENLTVEYIDTNPPSII